MLFNSFEFLVFFIVITILYFLLPHKLRWVLLLVASCYFYMAFVPIYILILLGTIIIDYIAGILIENAKGEQKRIWLTMSIIANVGVLAVFKYYNFIADNLNLLFSNLSLHQKIPFLQILLPIGLSFHTFQAMSYTIEVYRGNQKAERHFGIYALYVMFYPQLVAGPIERPQNMLYQFHEKHYFNIELCIEGVKKMIWGFFKKVVIADRLALVVDTIYKYPRGHTGIEYLIVMVLFSFQIYCDFSAYSDIAIGSAEVMGFKLMTNFNSPFKSKSITEFWRRWHISLSTWFNDYLFTPLLTKYRNGGNIALALCLIITFVISGVWHGAGWKFMVYGLIFGIAVAFESITRKKRKKLLNKLPLFLNNFICLGITYLYVIIAMVFFRSDNINDAFYIIGHINYNWQSLMSIKAIHQTITDLGGDDTIYGLFNISIGSFFILFIILIEHFAVHCHPINIFKKRSIFLRWSYFYFLIFCILVLGVYENKEFIYFQF